MWPRPLCFAFVWKIYFALFTFYMPPAANTRSVRFGADTAADVTEAENTAMNALSGGLGESVRAAQLYRCNRLNPPNGFLLFLASLSVVSFPTLVYSYGPFAALRDDGAALPTNDVVRAWLESDADNTFQWTSAADAGDMEVHKDRVVGRVMMILSDARDFVQSPVTPQEDDDAPISVATKASCERTVSALYGAAILPSNLPMPNILGKVWRGMLSIMFVFRLTNVLAQNENGGEDILEFVEGGMRKKRKRVRIATMTDFLFRLQLLMNGFVFVGTAFLAPITEFGGDASHGIAGGKRYQFSRSDKDYYIEFWYKVAQRFENAVEKAIHFENQVRQLVPNFQAEGYSLASALRMALAEKRTEISGWTRPVKPFAPPDGPTKRGGPSGVTGQPPGPSTGQQRFDKAKGATGFDPNKRTCTHTADGRQICKHFNDRRNNSDCPFGANCRMVHCCDVLVNGKCCESLVHHRLTHV